MKNFICVLASILSAASFAFPGLPGDSIPRSGIRKCADFSGNWKGACLWVGTGQKQEVDWKFVQTDCDLLDTGTRLIPIGGQLTFTWALGAGKISSATSAGHWDKTHTVLSTATTGMGPDGLDGASTTYATVKLKDSHTLLVSESRLDGGSPSIDCVVTR